MGDGLPDIDGNTRDLAQRCGCPGLPLWGFRGAEFDINFGGMHPLGMVVEFRTTRPSAGQVNSGTCDNSVSARVPIRFDSSRDVPGGDNRLIVTDPSLNGGRNSFPKVEATTSARPTAPPCLQAQASDSGRPGPGPVSGHFQPGDEHAVCGMGHLVHRRQKGRSRGPE